MVRSIAIASVLGVVCGACGARAPVAAPAASSALPAAAVAASPPSCARPDDATFVMIGTTRAGPPEPLYAAGRATLTEQGFSIIDSTALELRTAPSYTWPRGSEAEAWHGEQHPGVEVVYQLRPQGDSTQLTLGARALCLVATAGGGAEDPSVGRTLEMLTALTLVNALRERLAAPAPP